MKIRLFSILLCMIILLSSCAPAVPDETTAGEITSESVTEPVEENVSLDGYKVIRPSKCAQSVVSAAVELKTRLAEVAKEIGIGDDWTKPGEELPAQAAEILVGDTDRPETAQVKAELLADDYAVKYFAESGRIVVCGGSDEATLKAIQYFLEYCISGGAITSSLSFFSNGEYAVKECILEGAPIKEYTIVIAKNANADEKYAASLVASAVAEKTGIQLATVRDEQTAEGKKIVISASANVPAGSYLIGADGGNVLLGGAGGLVVKAARRMIELLFPTGESEVSLTFGSLQTVEFERPSYPELADFGTKPIALADQLNASIAVYDIASGEAVLKYEFKPKLSKGFSLKGYANRIDEARLRYSEKWGTYIMLFTSSSGYCSVASYPAEECLWEAELGGTSPHSIEYLPNGMVVVASSGGSNADKGFIRVYSAEKKNDGKYAEQLLNGAHAVLWDETRDILWAMGYTDIVAYELGDVSTPSLRKIDFYGSNQMKGGHDLSAIHGDDDKVWVGGSIVRIFDKTTGALISNYEGATQIDSGSVKCICSFTDGSAALTVATKVYADHNTDRFRLYSFENGAITQKVYEFSGRAFYKARSFIASYN